jgi:hypothetical protein
MKKDRQQGLSRNPDQPLSDPAERRLRMRTPFLLVMTCCLLTSPTFAQTAADPAQGSDYKINKFVSPATGQPIYFLRCNNGTTRCAYDWNSLCENAKPLNADLLQGMGGKEPTFIRDKDGTPLRMFVCASPG